MLVDPEGYRYCIKFPIELPWDYNDWVTKEVSHSHSHCYAQKVICSSWPCLPQTSGCAGHLRFTTMFQMSNPVSTHQNPFAQGGWESASGWKSQPASGPVAVAVPMSQSSSLPCTWLPEMDVTPTSNYLSFKIMLPESQTSQLSCVAIDSNDRLVYTVASIGTNVTLIKNTHKQCIAIIDTLPEPSVDIRGNKGKKRIDKWLLRDTTNLYVLINLCRNAWVGD